MSTSPAPCDLETAVAAAARTGCWTDALREHSETCLSCSEVSLVAGLLQREAALIADEQLLPDPKLLWLQAQLRARRDTARRATRSIAVMQVIAWVCGAALALALLLWQGPTLFRSLTGMLPGSLVATTTAGIAQPWLVLTISAAAIIFLMLLDRSSSLLSD